jgi:hypothetical protein
MIPLLAIGVIIILGFAVIALKVLFLPAGIITILLFRQVYEWRNASFWVADLTFMLSIITLVSLACLLFFGICLFFPFWDRCTLNGFNAIGFGIVAFPIVFGLILWAFGRLPTILKLLFKKMR